MSMPEEARPSYVLKQAQHALERAMDARLRPLGLTVPQHAALNAVDRMPGATGADLARVAFVTPQTMHGILAGLLAQGLVAREPDPAHGRRLVLRLTPEGRARLDRSRAAVGEVEAVLEAAAGPSALGLLGRVRDALRAARAESGEDG